MNINPPFQKDFYKASHKPQFPDNTEVIYNNFTSRSSRIQGINKVVFFGLQYFLKEYLINQWNANFFGSSIKERKDSELANPVNKELHNNQKIKVISRYKRMMDATLGKDTVDVKGLEDLWDLGYLPLEIKALEEGSVVPTKVPMFTIKNTDPRFFWLSNYIETIISCILWGPITSATTASIYKSILDVYCRETGGDQSFTQWQGHDFSMRGMFGLEAACLSGAAHLLSFTGTDTIPAIEFLEKYYRANVENELVGASVSATEHSVMSAGGKDGEFGTFERLITQIYPKGIVSIVSDTYDLWNVINNYLPKLKEKILARDGKVVIRPDSGDPVAILCGYIQAKDYTEVVKAVNPHHWTKFYYIEDGKYYRVRHIKDSQVNAEIFESTESECKGVIELLWDIFGGTTNEKGFKVLDPHIGVIYGDSITTERCLSILSLLHQKKFVSTIPVLGIGSFSYQFVTRDTFGMAMKATYCEVNGESRDIFKDPITDSGIKKSAKGLLMVTKNEEGEFILKDQCTKEEESTGELKTVFLNGELTKETTLSEIRTKLSDYMTVKTPEPVTEEV